MDIVRLYAGPWTVNHVTLEIVRLLISPEEVDAWEVSSPDGVVAYVPDDGSERARATADAIAALGAAVVNPLERAREGIRAIGGEAALNRAIKAHKEKRRKERKLFRKILRWLDAKPDIEDDEDGWKLRNRIAETLEWGHE